MHFLVKRFLAILCIFIAFTSCVTQFKAENLQSRIVTHKTIAIIPFEAQIEFRKIPKEVSLEDIEEMKKQLGFNFQERLFARFNEKSEKYEVLFQDINITNKKLSENNIDYLSLRNTEAKDLAEILGVDAVVTGKVITSRPYSVAASIAVDILSPVMAPTNEIDALIRLHDGETGEVLYAFSHVYQGSWTSSAESLARQMIRKIEKKFPYRG